jgi:hypothetical protein
VRRREAPTAPVRCVRRHWPRVFAVLERHGANFTTTAVIVNDFDAGHVELLVEAGAVGLLDRLVERMAAGRDPWPGRLRANAAAERWRVMSDLSALPNPPRGWSDDDPWGRS